MKRWLSIVLLILVVAVAAFQISYYYPRLPDKMISHLDAKGIPNGWSDKNDFLMNYGKVLAILSVTFIGILLGLSYLPTSLVNIPNKEYWLAPEREKKTVEYFIVWLSIFGSGVMLLLMYALHKLFLINTVVNEPAVTLWLPLSVFLLFNVVMIYNLFVRFSRYD